MAARRTIARVTTRVSLALLGLAVAVLQGLDQTKIVHVSKWWELAGLVGVGLITFGDNTRALIQASSEAKRSEAKRKVFRDTVAALSTIAEKNSISIMHLGASVFLIKKKIVWVGWRKGFWRRPEILDRWDRIRLSDHPQPSKVRWSLGKGAVGSAWKTGRAAHRDWKNINARWGSRSPTTQQFAGMAAHTRAGLEHAEFVALLGKYSETLAVPIMNDGGRVFGVLSVDVACTGNVPTILDDRDVEKLLENTVGLVRPELGK
jgi:hypothetical protein